MLLQAFNEVARIALPLVDLRLYEGVFDVAGPLRFMCDVYACARARLCAHVVRRQEEVGLRRCAQRGFHRMPHDKSSRGFEIPTFSSFAGGPARALASTRRSQQHSAPAGAQQGPPLCAHQGGSSCQVA